MRFRLDVSVDFESQQEISFSVIATDAAGNASTEQSVTVDVTNLDEARANYYIKFSHSK